jgi:hypothetical protein
MLEWIPEYKRLEDKILRINIGNSSHYNTQLQQMNFTPKTIVTMRGDIQQCLINKLQDSE